MPVEDLDLIEIERHNVWCYAIKVQGLQHLHLPQALEEVIMIFVHVLLLFFDLLDELGSWVDYVQRWVHERSNLHRLNVRLIQKFIVGGDLNLAVEVWRHYKQLLRGPHAKCYILRIIFVFVDQLLLGEALDNVWRVQAVHAIVVKEEQVARVKRFLDLKHEH